MEVDSLDAEELRSATRALLRRTQSDEADLLVLLAAIDERKLFLDWAFPSMFAFCVEDLGFSEDTAYNRIQVARACRRFPAIVDAVRNGDVHLAGLRLLIPHLTDENHRGVLGRAAHRSKRDIEELVAALAPQPPVPTIVRKVPDKFDMTSVPEKPTAANPADLFRDVRDDAVQRDATPMPHVAVGSGEHGAAVLVEGASATLSPVDACVTPSAPEGAPRAKGDRRVVVPLSASTYRIQFTAPRSLRDKLRQAQELLRHRVPDGDVAEIFERALDLLIAKVMKERFGIGCKPRRASPDRVSSRPRPRVPAAAMPIEESAGGRAMKSGESSAGRREQQQTRETNLVATGTSAPRQLEQPRETQTRLNAPSDASPTAVCDTETWMPVQIDDLSRTARGPSPP